MKVRTAFTNRLGNRSSNQDRCLVTEKSGRILLCVADGMGGHARGDLAAQVAVDSLSNSFQRQQGMIIDPPAFLKSALQSAHLEVVETGHAMQPAITPRTTCVACLVQDGQAHWAHVGDSRLYLFRNGELMTRTRDHTPVEELLQSGAISEADLSGHPMRNSVNRCLGGEPVLPKISFDQTELESGDTLLLCSDGLWAALSEQRLLDLHGEDDLEHAVEQLANDAEKASYPHSDNISAVGLRWLAAANSAKVSTGAEPAQSPPGASAEETEKDPVQQAIDDIHRAMLEYASEMKK
jgi:serine/threonine protein phosphatase PrpC